MRPRPLADASCLLPDTWAWMPDMEGADHVVATQLCDGEDTQAELAERLRQARPELNLQKQAGTAVWVPRRDSSEVQGYLQIQRIVPDEGHQGEECSREHWRSMIEPDPRTWCTVYSQTIDEVDVPAGPTLVVREVMAKNGSPDSGQEPLTDNTTYFIFPPGSTDSMEFLFRTTALQLGDELAAEAAWIADTVEITLGEPA